MFEAIGVAAYRVYLLSNKKAAKKKRKGKKQTMLTRAYDRVDDIRRIIGYVKP